MDVLILCTLLASALTILLMAMRWFTQNTKGMCKSQRRMDGRTVIITGANAGIGKETARDLAQRGARVIMACRSMDRGQAAMKDIKATVKDADIVLIKCDLASYKSIRDFCDQITQNEARLDVLILNAGLICPRDRFLTEDGHEMQFQSNHLGHFLMVSLLMDLLKQSAPARIVVVSSILNIFGSIDFDNLNLEKEVPEPFWTYSKTKLCNILMTKELTRRLKGTGITANSLHPGLVVTDINRDRPWYVRMFLYPPMTWFYGKNMVEGAQTTIHLAVDENVASSSGKFYADCGEFYCSWKANDEQLSRKLWNVSAEMVGIDADYI